MDKDTKKKLVFAILQGDDYEQVVRELNKKRILCYFAQFSRRLSQETQRYYNDRC